MNSKELHERDQREIADIARIGFIEDFSLEVYVRTDDGGNEPHVHVWDRGTKGEKFSTAVSLKEPKYTPHGDKYKDTFNSRQKKAFAEFMKEKISESRVVKPVTNYEYCCYLWNKNNSNVSVEVQYDENDNPIIPDYTQL